MEKTQRILEVDFIIDCRNGKKHAYDIVIGAMADDQIYNYISDYLDGSITREQFWILVERQISNGKNDSLSRWLHTD